MKNIKYQLLLFLILIFGCDFRSPQSWETPSWNLPLSIPLFNDIIKIGDMINTGYNCTIEDISIHSDYIFESLDECQEACFIEQNGEIEYGCETIFSLEPNVSDSSYHISIDTTMIEKDEISISDEYFFTEPMDLDISIDVTPIKISKDALPSIDEQERTELSELINLDDFDSFDCIPQSVYDEVEPITMDPITIAVYDEINVDNIEYLDLVHSITIDEGAILLSVDNKLPFMIEVLKLEFLNGDGDPWEENEITNINYNESAGKTVELDGKVIPEILNITPIIIMSEPEAEDCIISAPLSDIDEELSVLWETPVGCATMFNQNLLNDQCDCTSTNASTECTLDINNSTECGNLETFYSESDPQDDVTLIWIGPDNFTGECEVFLADGYDFSGGQISGNSALSINYSFSIDEGRADVKITMEEQISSQDSPDDSQNLDVAEGIDLLSAKITSEGLEASSNKNKLILNFTNNLFSEIDLTLQLEDFYDKDLNPVIWDVDNQPDGNPDADTLILSNCYIGHPDSIEPLEAINYLVNYGIVKEHVEIVIGESYYFDLPSPSGTLKSLEFENLKVNLEEFTSPPIEMGDIPAGFEGFSLPTLSFDLKFYNEINAPLTLNLDLIGNKDDGAEPVVIHVEPELKYFGTSASPIDSSILSIVDTELIVLQYPQEDCDFHGGVILDNICTVSTSYSFGTNLQGENLSIYDVFAGDDIEVNGYAVLAGESTLERGKSVWADMEVNIDPLTIIITDDISFVSEAPTEMEPIDATTSEKIDSGIVSATVDLQFENAIPLDGTINMIVSNSEKIPSCLDTLTSGLISEQESLISNDCMNYIKMYHSSSTQLEGPDSIIVQSRSEYNFYYIEFYIETDTTFFGKFLNMPLILPNEIDNGVVVTPSTYTESLDLLGDEIKWLTNDNILYISPQILLFKYDENTADPDDDGKRTIQSSNYLQINSLLTLILDMGEITESRQKTLTPDHHNE